jgi:ubiquinol-cytochrome c reductase cytochrome b subunit
MIASILIIISMIFLDTSKVRGFQYRPLSKVAFYSFVAVFLGLMVLGAKHVESPYIELGQIFTVVYFLYFLLLIPGVSFIENNFIKLNIK